ncbi:MAG: tol-pal system-associated acyl-CoA thioesterase [Gammaproteobacteria bacterium]|jgi:tol-pal system-associated acyl-CoA thioesterase|nr:tol-pal system-associated acyl-CoA thioesterase [Gammaproteobacteria bacterium]MBU0771388.1 tol-pal system-associated acyl-CoA thioesterase [Gammaproteobacteria bacterium]MBU0857096.1 tol-pal system-associated acyl-CoA thioesterase [Gammaproteobacteria bacterium]MBU1847974.1 tol-pal system-associated acyl-CoA thioesterase [Gammaproteobacteria bacterium]
MNAPAQHVDGFSWPVRVYYEDTDSYGVVYYANYFKFAERARTEWLRELGFDQVVMAGQGYGFVVRSARGEYLRPARFNDALEMRSTVSGISRVAVDFTQRLYRGEELLFDAVVRVVCIDPARSRPVSLPATLRARLSPSTLAAHTRRP